uniref:Lymphocyte specific protein 1 a n=1 Tax=Hucho hucho TaxID=62062 RepID=A0A4W5MHB5_9TELE
MEELNRRREERRKAREEEEHLREKEEQHRQEQEEEEKKSVKDGMERRRASASERRMKNLSISSIEGDESFSPFSPMSPTLKNDTEERMTSENTSTINERTESLNRSLQKSNSIKKTQPPIPISKIDNRLEQYTHAIEEVKAGDVLSKKNLWENLGDSSPSGRLGKGASSGKKHKFVMMAHGKYEKVAVGDDDYNEHTNGKSTGQRLEEL